MYFFCRICLLSWNHDWMEGNRLRQYVSHPWINYWNNRFFFFYRESFDFFGGIGCTFQGNRYLPDPGYLSSLADNNPKHKRDDLCLFHTCKCAVVVGDGIQSVPPCGGGNSHAAIELGVVVQKTKGRQSVSSTGDTLYWISSFLLVASPGHSHHFIEQWEIGIWSRSLVHNLPFLSPTRPQATAWFLVPNSIFLQNRCTIHSEDQILFIRDVEGVTYTGGDPANLWNLLLLTLPILIAVSIGSIMLLIVIIVGIFVSLSLVKEICAYVSLFFSKQKTGWRFFVQQWRLFFFLLFYTWIYSFVFSFQIDSAVVANDQYAAYAAYLWCLFLEDDGLRK